MHQCLQPLINSGEISDLSMRSYKPEVERYGQQNIRHAEAVFSINSQCVVKLLQCIQQQQIPEQKLSVILLAINQYLKDFGLNDNETLSFLRTNRNSFAREFRLEESKELKLQVQQNYRNSSAHLAKLLATEELEESPMKGFAEIKHILHQQSVALEPLLALTQKALKNDRDEYLRVLASYAHMYVNRFFASNARFQEFIVYEFLERHQLSVMARRKKMLKEV